MRGRVSRLQTVGCRCVCSINYCNDAARPQALAAAGLGTAMGHLHTAGHLLIPGRYILVSQSNLFRHSKCANFVAW